MAKGDQRSRLLTLLGFASILIAAVTVSTLMRWLLPRWMFPFDLFLIATVAVALQRRPMTSQLFGLAAGLCRDAFTGGIIGLHAFALTTIGLVVAGLKEAVLISGAPQQGLAFAVASISQALILMLVNALFSLQHTVNWTNVGLETLFNTAAGFVLILYFNRRRQRMSSIRS